MELQQVKNLKLNATRIKSTLIKSNKQIRKLKVQERNFLATQQNETRKQQKEAVIEASSALKGPQTLATRILAGPLSLFEKIKQFFGTVLLGILVNNLPLIVQKIQKFLDDNKVIIVCYKNRIFLIRMFRLSFLLYHWHLQKEPKPKEAPYRQFAHIPKIFRRVCDLL